MIVKRWFESSDRYTFDFGPCSLKNGFAQVDTEQDASYFGTWANPETRTIVNYCEGDVTEQIAETDEEFAAALRELKEWNEKSGRPRFGIDPGFSEDLAARFRAVGLGDMLP